MSGSRGAAAGDVGLLVQEAGRRLRILILAGVPAGVLIGGIGGRLAMLLLRSTSPETVIGVTSDDGFTIGQFTLSGTYNLLVLGAAVGLIGAVAYWAVAPWLIGPTWFRRLTVALACGAVVGSMLVHADGVDFVLLKPTWFAVALFVAIPTAFGAVIGPAVDGAERVVPVGPGGVGGWTPPLVLIALFPFVLPVVLMAAAVVLVWTVLRPVVPRHLPAPVVLVIRAAWLTIAGGGLVALVRDINRLA
ncbi:MAG: hypothetical protein OER95_00940 [Acidimicrobiia bacterium]|nr:hypothetical protein [Acidimicrobiia bacterium]